MKDIEAEFHGNKAKLEWVVSLDRKKTESETYKVVAILGVATSNTLVQSSEPSSRNAVSNTSQVANTRAVQSADFADVMIWFDEPAPGPSTEIRDVVITARAYDGVLNVMRKLRDSDTSVKSGVSVLDVDYHPPSFRLGTILSAKQSLTVFHWDDEVPADPTLVMHIRVSRRVYDNVTNAIGHLRVDTFMKE